MGPFLLNYSPMNLSRALMFIVCLGLSGAGTSVAQKATLVSDIAPPTPIVEIFVSRNCAACPKALKNLRELDEVGTDFLQLTWSVDYWDYLGEADAMAIPASSVRQRHYAERMALRGPYTPQTVFNGNDETSGARKGAVRRRLVELAKAPLSTGLKLSVTDGVLQIDGPQMPDSEVHLLTVSSLEADSGQWLENAVLSAEKIADWNGGTLETNAPCVGRCVALVQGVNYGPIYGCVEFRGPQLSLPNH